MQENSDVTVMSRCDSLFSACLQVRLEATVWQKFKDNALQMEGEGWRGGGGVEGRGRGGQGGGMRVESGTGKGRGVMGEKERVTKRRVVGGRTKKWRIGDQE